MPAGSSSTLLNVAIEPRYAHREFNPRRRAPTDRSVDIHVLSEAFAGKPLADARGSESLPNRDRKEANFAAHARYGRDWTPAHPELSSLRTSTTASRRSPTACSQTTGALSQLEMMAQFLRFLDLERERASPSGAAVPARLKTDDGEIVSST